MANTPTMTIRLPYDLRDYYTGVAKRESRTLGATLVLVLNEWRVLNETGALHLAREGLDELPDGSTFVGASTMLARHEVKRRKK